MAKDHKTKASRYEIAERVNQVIKWLVSGWSHKQICDYAIENEDELSWGVNKEMVRIYIKKAIKALVKETELNRSFYINESIARLQSLYETAIIKENYQFAKEIELSKQELLSLKEYSNKEFVQSIKGTVDFRFEPVSLDKFEK